MAVSAAFIALFSVKGCSILVGGSVASAVPLDNFKSVGDLPQTNSVTGVKLTKPLEEVDASEPDISVKVETASPFKVGHQICQFLPQPFPCIIRKR